MKIVTLTTEAMARRGAKFKANIHPKCLTCKLYKVCVSRLRPGFYYEVLKVRNKVHICPITGSRMRVVEVKPLPVSIVVESNFAVAGVTFNYEPIICDNIDCDNYDICSRSILIKGEKVKVIKVAKTLRCPLGRRLSLVRVLPLSLL